MKSVSNSTHSLTYPTEISVIVCHHKGDFIDKFVASVKRSFGVKYEILIMTSDENLAVTGMKGCQTFYSEKMPAEKRNTGARLSSGKYIAFFDDDVEIEPNCLLTLKKALDSNPSVGMVYGKLYNMEHRNRFDEAGGYLTSTGFIYSRAEQNLVDCGQYDTYDLILAGKSASCMMREEVFFEAGQFDEDFGILGEETDLSWRVWLKGHKVLFVPDAVGYHAFNTKFKPAKEYYTSDRVHYNGCRNYIVMLLKNLEKGTLWKILPLHISAWIFAGCAMIATLKIAQGINIFRGLIYCVNSCGNIAAKRRKVQEKRKISDRELWPFIFTRAPRGYYTQRLSRYLRIGLHG